MCRACGGWATNCHHLLGKGQGGDDAEENLVPLCGSGATGCHGALHGNAYVVTVTPGASKTRFEPYEERRDARWVRVRIGLRLRPSEYGYLREKLSPGRAAEHLRRFYHVELDFLYPFKTKEAP